MFQRILVPLDGSACAERALPVAARLARTSGGSIIMLRVVTSKTDFLPSMGVVQPMQIAQTEMDTDFAQAELYLAQLTVLSDLVGISTETVILAGNPPSTILSVASSYRADVIVLYSHGTTELKWGKRGSVTHKVVRLSPVPVLVLRSGKDNSIDPYTSDKKPFYVLATLDGSPLAETVLKPLAQVISRLALPCQYHINLLYVVNIANHFDGLHDYAYSDRDILKQARMRARLYMQTATDHLYAELACALPSLNFTITSSVKFRKDIPDAIIDVAEHGDIGEENPGSYDLLAMATHGRSAILHQALGSVTERVLDGTKLSLLIAQKREVQI